MRVAALALAVLPLLPLLPYGGGARAAARCEDLGQAFAALPAAFHERPPSVIAASSDRNLWLAAERALAHWDGCHLRSVALPERAAAMRIFSLSTSSPDELWLTAVAESPGVGVVDDGIFRWDGRRWAEVPRKGERVPVALRLWGARRGEVWLAGGGVGDRQAVLLRSDGRAVTPVTPAPAATTANAGGSIAKGPWRILGGSSSADVWLKDQSHNGMLHFDGRGWTEVKPGPDLAFGFGAMWGDRPDAMFGIGQSSGAPAVWRWDGRRLSALPPLPSAGSPQFVTGAAGTLLVATSEGAVFSFDGKAWTRRFAFRADGELFAGRGSVGGYLSAMQAGWAVASVGRSDTVLLGWDGSRLRVHGGAAAETVTAVWAAGADDVWATTSSRTDDGARPLGAVLHRVNGRWIRVAEARAHLLALSVAGPDDVWAAGTGGTSIQCKGKGKGAEVSCRTIATGTDDALVSLWRADSGRVWAGGREGTLLEWDGSAWKPRAQPRGWKLNALVGTGGGEIWAAGSGTNVAGLLRWSGGGWTRTVFDAFVVGDALVPVSLAAGPAEGLWAAGQRRNENNFETSVVKWNGQRWQEKGRYSIGRNGNANLTVVAATGGTVWVAGTRLWRLAASGDWEEMDTGAAKGPIYALSAAGDVLWAAAGDAATPVRIEPAPKAPTPAGAPAGGKANLK